VTTRSEAETKVISGAAWSDFCDALKNAGSIVLSDQPEDPLTRAEGFRYLSRLTRAALETFVERADPSAPVLARVVHETVKMGADNPDAVYAHASLSSAYRYRIRGAGGTLRYLSFATQVGHYGRSGGMPPTGQLDSTTLKVGEDGRFDVIVACERPARLGPTESWLPMTKDTGTLIVRQIRLSPGDRVAELSLEREGEQARPEPLSCERLDEGLTSAAMLVQGAAMLFASWTKMFEAHTNQLPRFDPETSNRFGGLADIAYYHSYFRLGEDEALVIDATPPPCDHWNFQLNNHWMESLDYRYFRVHTNSALATGRPDGSIRIVVAHRDPGVPNWLETAGHRFGTMCFRWVRPEGEPPTPQCRVVPVDEVRSLP